MKLTLEPTTFGDTSDLWALALRLADFSNGLIKDRLGERLSVEQKADRSFVTDLDKLVEEQFRERIQKYHPEAGVIGEEFGRLRPEADYQWVIDPIDGTAELVAGIPIFGTVITLLYKNYPIVGVFDHPVLGLRVHAARGKGCFRNNVPITLTKDMPAKPRLHIPPGEAFVRRGQTVPEWYLKVVRTIPATRTYFTCLSVAGAASGGLDATLEWDLRIWDFGGAPVLVEEAGGRFEVLARYPDDEGEERFCFLMGNEALVSRVKSLMNEAG